MTTLAEKLRAGLPGVPTVSAIADCVEALEPFAAYSQRYDEIREQSGYPTTPDFHVPDITFTHGDLRRARAALSALQRAVDGEEAK